MLHPAFVDARPIDVMTTTSLSIEADALGLELELAVTLRDNVAQALAYRPVLVTVTCPGATPAELELETDAAGVAQTSHLGSAGTCSVEAAYRGDRFHDGVSASATITVERASLELIVDAPRTVQGTAWHGLVAAAGSSAGRPVDLADAALSSDCLSATATDAVGTWEIAPTPDGPATCAWRLVVPDTVHHTGAEARGAVRTIDEPRMTAVVEPQRDRPFAPTRWFVHGEVRDASGPVAGGRVEVRVDGGEPLADRTDAAGHWGVVASLPRGAHGQHRVEARFVPDLPADAPGASIRTAFVVPRSITDQVPLATFATLAVLLLFLGAARAVIAWRRRRPRAERPGAGIHETAVPGPVMDDAPSSAEIRLVLRDADTGWAIAGRIDADVADAHHVIDVGADGQGWLPRPAQASTITLRAQAAGYVPLESTVRAPRPGRALVVRLVSVRSRVRRILEELVADLALGDALESRWWGRRTTSEVRDVLARQLRHLRHAPDPDPVARRELLRLVAAARTRGERGPAVEAAEALAMFADDVTFGDRGWDEDAVTVAARLAERVRTSLREGAA